MNRAAYAALEKEQEEKDMIKKNDSAITLYVCTHHLDCHAVISSILLHADGSVEINCVSIRSRKHTWSCFVSLAHVANILLCCAQDCPSLIYPAIAQSISLSFDGELSCSLQHIKQYGISTSSYGQKAYVLASHTKDVESLGESWLVDFYSECEPPFILEVRIQRHSYKPRKYYYRIESRHLRELFDDACAINTYTNLYVPYSRLDPPKRVKDMLRALTDGLIFDAEGDIIFVRSIEVLKLTDYYLSTTTAAREREIDDSMRGAKKTAMEESIRHSVLVSLGLATEAKVVTTGGKDSNKKGSSTQTLSRHQSAVGGKSLINSAPQRRILNSAAAASKLSALEEARSSSSSSSSSSTSADSQKIVEVAISAKERAKQVRLQDMPMFIVLREALNSRQDTRSLLSIGTIIQFLRCTELAPYLDGCSQHDLTVLARGCTLREHLKPLREQIAVKEDMINIIYLIVKGSVQLDFGEDFGSKSMGDCLGLEVLHGVKRWDADIETIRGDGLVLCCLTVDLLFGYVGRAGVEPQEYLACFWRYTRLFKEIEKSRFEPLFSSTSSSETTQQQQQDRLNVIQCAKVRCFQPGSDIFRQGENRFHLFFIVQGECAVLRQFPAWASQVIPEEVDMGLRLMSGDFMFMDGEPVDWIQTMQGRGVESAGDGYAVIGGRGKKEWVFGNHKNTLIALTRVEACCIPIAEVARSFSLFAGLMKISQAKYSHILKSDEEVIELYHRTREWESIRGQAIKTVFLNRDITTPLGMEYREGAGSRQSSTGDHRVFTPRIGSSKANSPLSLADSKRPQLEVASFFDANTSDGFASVSFSPTLKHRGGSKATKVLRFDEGEAEAKGVQGLQLSPRPPSSPARSSHSASSSSRANKNKSVEAAASSASPPTRAQSAPCVPPCVPRASSPDANEKISRLVAAFQQLSSSNTTQQANTRRSSLHLFK